MLYVHSLMNRAWFMRLIYTPERIFYITLANTGMLVTVGCRVISSSTYKRELTDCRNAIISRLALLLIIALLSVHRFLLYLAPGQLHPILPA